MEGRPVGAECGVCGQVVALAEYDEHAESCERDAREASDASFSREVMAADRVGRTQEPFECTVCLTNYEEHGDGVTFRQCGHTLCCECVRRHSVACDEENRIVTCPFCSEAVLETDMEGVVDRALVGRQEQRLLRLYTARFTVGCPTPDCTNVFELAADARPDHLCGACGRRVCLRCQVSPWHESSTCKEYKAAASTDEDVEARVAKGELRRCPQCGILSQKMDGCNAVRCATCQAHWCWHCGSAHDECTCGENPHRAEWFRNHPEQSPWGFIPNANVVFQDPRGIQMNFQQMLDMMFNQGERPPDPGVGANAGARARVPKPAGRQERTQRAPAVEVCYQKELTALTVGEAVAALKELRVDYRDCVEKPDLIALLEQHLPNRRPTAAVERLTADAVRELSVRQLKEELRQRRVGYHGCVERSELVERLLHAL